MSFVKQALRTESKQFHPINIRLLHAVLGIAGESGEIAELNSASPKHKLVEEVGDLLWYVAIFSDEYGIDFEYMIEAASNSSIRDCGFKYLANEVTQLSLKMAETLKKSIFYGKDKDDIKFNIQDILSCLQTILYMFNSDFQEAQESVIHKLEKRFPDKFNPDFAINKNELKD